VVHRGLHARRAQDAAGQGARPGAAPRNARYDGRFRIPTLQQVIDLTRGLSRRLDRPIGIYPETKHPTYFRRIGLALERPLIRVLRRNDLDRRGARVFVQSFETRNLRRLNRRLSVRLVQLFGEPELTPFGESRTYGQLATRAGLRRIARYADGVGPPKEYIVPRDPSGASLPATGFVPRAHRAGLVVHPYTFRNENAFLPLELRSGPDPAAHGRARAEYRRFFSLGVDGVFSDHPDTAVAARPRQ
jgi:glycerophosphoryl diester phosphodiesterase